MCKISFCLLYGNWTWNDTVGSVSCDYCNLTQCVNQSWWKEFERWACNSNFSLIIVKARTEVWLPINLTRSWSDSFAVSHLVTAVQTLLHWSQRMLGVVIASILAVVSVTATAAVAGLALHQGIQTADYGNNKARFGCTTCYQRAQSSTHRFLAWRSISCFIYTKCIEMCLEFLVLYSNCTI